MITSIRKNIVKNIKQQQISKIAIDVEVLKKTFAKWADISSHNFKIMGRLIAITEVLKDKGIITDEEVKTKFEELQAANEARARELLDAERARIIAEKDGKSDQNQGDIKRSILQSEDTGNNENNSGGPKLSVLSNESNGGDSGSGSSKSE